MNETLALPGEALLPYDDATAYPGFWHRMLSTFRAFVLHPSASAECIPNSDYKRDGLSFFLAFAWPLAVVTEGIKCLALYSPWLQSHVIPASVLAREHVSILSSVLTVVFFPIGAWVGFWIGAALMHGSLWVWRGLHGGLGIHQTARAVGFALGLTRGIPMIIWVAERCFHHGHTVPHLGVLMRLLEIAFFGYLLAKTHRTALWRGIAASATPSLLVLFAETGFSPSLFVKILLA